MKFRNFKKHRNLNKINSSKHWKQLFSNFNLITIHKFHTLTKTSNCFISATINKIHVFSSVFISRDSSVSIWFPEILFPSQTSAREFIKTFFFHFLVPGKFVGTLSALQGEFVSANEASERGEDESIFTAEKASFRCDVSITPFD